MYLAPLFVITATYHLTVSVALLTALGCASPALTGRRHPTGDPHEIRRLHFLLANGKKISYTVRLGRWGLKDCRFPIDDWARRGSEQGLEAGMKAGMFEKTKEIPEYDWPI
jgi:hypothetical protein